MSTAERIEPMKQLRLAPLLKEKELWILVLAGLLYFYRPLFFDETFFFRDLYSNFLPQKQLLADFLAAKEFPLWNPYLNGGQAYLANIANAVLDPLNLLYWRLPLLDAFNIELVLRVTLCSVFAYIAGRIVSLSPLSSLVVGTIYGFSGYTLSLLNVLNMLRAMMFLPLLVGGWHLFLLNREKRWFVFTVVTGVMQLFAGAPEITILSVVFLLGWSVFFSHFQCSVVSRLLLWCLLGGFIVGIAFVQILPTLELMLQSPRAHGLSFSDFSYWSLHPKRVLEMIFPGFLGHVDTLNDFDYWGMSLVDGSFPCILSLYLGGITLALASLGGVCADNTGSWASSFRRFLLFWSFGSFLLSLGRFLPFFEKMYEHIPLITVFRFPIKFLSAGIFPIALLAGYAIELSFREDDVTEHVSGKKGSGDSSFGCLVVMWSVLIVLSLLMMVFFYSEEFASHFQQFFFERVGGEVSVLGVRRSLIHALAFWALVTLLYQYRQLRKGAWQQWTFVAVLMMDFLVAGARINPTVPREFLASTPAVARLIHSQRGGGRVFRSRPPSNPVLRAPSNDIIWRYRWNLETLDSRPSALFRIPSIYHDDLVKLLPTQVMDAYSFMNTLPWKQRIPLLSAGGVTVIMAHDALDLPGIRKIAEIPNASNVHWSLYYNERAISQVEFVTNWKLVDSDSEAIAAVVQPNFDPRKTAIIQPQDAHVFLSPRQKNISSRGADDMPAQSCPSSKISLTQRASNASSAIFEISNDCDGFLVFSELYYPGWKIAVDGKPVSVRRANYAFSGIFLKRGEHIVKRYYLPDSLVLGGLGSFICVGLLIFMTTRKGVFCFGKDTDKTL